MKSLMNWKKSTSSDRTSNPLVSLQEEIDRAINNFYNIFETPSSYPTSTIEKLIIHPSVDIVEDDQHFKVEVEMPGMGEEDVKVTVNGKILSIQGKKEISKKNEGKNYISREIGYGSYVRNISLPEYVEADKAKASFKKGMLWITFPKKADSEQRSQEIKIEKAN